MTESVAIVTGEDAPELTDDGRRVRARLDERGFDAEAAVWRDSSVEWEAFDAALIRSCWKYYTDPEGFREWLSALEAAGVAVFNPPEVVRWNFHKRYLLDLADCGVPVVPTEVVEDPKDRSLSGILRDRGWDEAVVKPTVGTSSAGVWKTTIETAADDQERFEGPFSAARRVGDSASNADDGEVMSERGTLVQEFVPEVREGELSLVFLGGEYSHAWRSLRAPDALPVEAAGNVSREYDPAPETVTSAREVLGATVDTVGVDRSELTHARVDGVVRDGRFELMELELIEPYLNLDRGDDAADALAGALETALADRVDAPTNRPD